jgi:hypothetical protein
MSSNWQSAPILVLASALFLQASPAELLETAAPVPLSALSGRGGALDITTDTGPALRNCRPLLASRTPGSTAWREESSGYQIVSRTGQRIVLSAAFPDSQAKATVTIDREPAGRLHFSGTLENNSPTPLEIARFHYLDGDLPDPATRLLSMRHYELPGRIIRPDDALKAPLHSNWGWQRLDDPVHARGNTGISGDSGALGRDWNGRGFFIGFTGPGTAFGEIGIRTRQDNPSFFVAVLLDGIRLEPGKARVLESTLVSHGDLQDELRHWFGRCAGMLGPPRVRPPLAGYCSWYQLGQKVKPADIRRAIRVFSTMEKPPGGHTIQIDDGFQVMPGDWSGRDEWKDELDKLPAEIRAKGFIPGIWVAPTAIYETHPIVKNHPDWLQRDATGNPCVIFHNWKTFDGLKNGKTYFLEPDHPQARGFIRNTLRDLRSKGWDYFKIDFAYTVSSKRVKYDPSKTTFESLRDQWRLFRESLGGDALINSCNGGIWRYTLGSVDVSRLGGDIGGNVGHLRRQLAEMMLRAHANGVWFQADPDVFYMRRENSALNFEQSHILTGTQGILGTAFLTSDFADQWTPEAGAVVKSYWNRSNPAFPAAQRLHLRDDGLPAALAVARGPGDFTVAIYNWDEHPADISLTLKDLRIPVGRYTATPADFGKESSQVANGSLTIRSQPACSLRILHLRPGN